MFRGIYRYVFTVLININLPKLKLMNISVSGIYKIKRSAKMTVYREGMIYTNFFYKNIVFWAQAWYSYENSEFQAEIILIIFLFLTLF